MGKESLIKSTTKKSASKKDKAKKKESTPSTGSAKGAKSAGSKKSKSAKTAADIEAAKVETKAAPTIEELLFKKFMEHTPSSQNVIPEPDLSALTAPPLIDTDDPAEAERLGALLARKFSMEEIIAAAQPPEEIITASEPSALPEERVTESAPEADATPAPEAQAPAQSEPAAPAPEAPSAPAETIQAPVDEAKPTEPEPMPPVAAEPPPAAPEPVAPPTEAPTAVEINPPAPQPAQSALQPKEAPPAPAPVEKSAPITPPMAHVPVTAGIAPPQSSPAPVVESKARPTDPVVRSAKIAAAAMAALVILILWASFSNHAKYFVSVKKGSVEIWQGDFSPTGRRFFAVLHGLQPTEPIQEEYRRNEIFPMIFDYYLEKSDALLEVSDLPDYRAIIEYLEKAEKYALNDQMRNAITQRLNHIQRLTLLYKAEVDASKGTAESLANAIDGLEQALRLSKDPDQAAVITQKIEVLIQRRAALEDAAAPAPAQEENATHE
jgi:hypothetical protein